MMKRAANFIRGSVRLEVEGRFPERFLNICGANGVGFWAVSAAGEGRLRLTVARRDRKRAAALGEKCGCRVTAAGSRGVPDFLLKFRRRYGFLAGLALAIGAVALLGQFVLAIRVEGNGAVPAGTILAALRREGFTVGTYGPAVDERDLENKVLLALPQLSYCAVNLQGVCAQVIVRERAAPPEVVDPDAPADVVAGRTGVVEELRVMNGRALAAEGDAVLAGDVLISSVVAFPAADGSEETAGGYQTRAMGEVTARTWRTLEAKVPLSAKAADPAGRTRRQFALRLGERRFNFYRKSGISGGNYVKITVLHTLPLPGDIALPAALVEERYVKAAMTDAALDRGETEAGVKALLEARLAAALPEGGQVVRRAWTVTETAGGLTVRLQAECLERIDKTVELAPEGAQSEEEG